MRLENPIALIEATGVVIAHDHGRSKTGMLQLST